MFKGMTLFPQETKPLELGKSLESFGRKTRERRARTGWPSLRKKKTPKRSVRMSKSTSKQSKTRRSSKNGSKISFRMSKDNKIYRSQENRSSGNTAYEFNSYLKSSKNSRSLADLGGSDYHWKTPIKQRHLIRNTAKKRRPMSAQIRNIDQRRKVRNFSEYHSNRVLDLQ